MKKLVSLTYPQKSILLTEKFYKNASMNNICGTAIIDSVLDFDALKQAIKVVIKENDVFHIHLTQKKNEVKQFISYNEITDIEIIDIKDESEVYLIEDALMAKQFNLYESDLFEFKIFRFENGAGGFLLNIHHIISDGWTLGLTCRKIMKAYSNIKNNENGEEETFSYIDYAKNEEEYFNSLKFQKDKEYWNELFSENINPAILPSDSSEKNTEFSCLGERMTFSIPKAKMKMINEYCSKNKLTVFNFLMAIYSVYISKIIGSDDFSIGTPILNRTNFKEKNIIGMFVNVVPFKVKVEQSADFISFASNLSKDTVSLLRHQKYPYQMLLEDLRKKDSSIPNLYNVVLSYQLTKANNETEYKYSTRWAFNKNVTDDMTIQFLDLDEQGILTVCYDFKKLKYSNEYVKNMHSRILEMINKVLETENICVKDIEIITKNEREKLLVDFNNTEVKYDKNKNVIKTFKEMVKKYPEKIAISFENRQMTYKELNQKSNILANSLIKEGAKAKDIIAICVNRSLELAIGLLAILKVGAAYLPIDPEYPEDRIEYMLTDSNAKMILSNKRTQSAINEKIKIKRIDIGLESTVYNRENIEIEEKILPEDLIYLIYTSGSTGKPKGVMLKHKNIINFLLGTKEVIDFNPEKIMVSITTICFDIFVLEFWGALTSGMTLVLANEVEQNNAVALNKLCLENKVTMIQTTPSRFKALLENKSATEFVKKMTDIMVGGEGLPKGLIDKFEGLTNANIFNMYGPTETAVWSTIKKVRSKDRITIGKPIANTKCYILDKDQNILPIYVPGELYIGGDGVSRGYLNRDELTNEKFIKSPFEKNEIIYNTNDLAYYTNSGEIVHLGRTDFQVKIRGYRIELEEIENEVNKIPGILNNVVVADENQKYLICYYISNEIQDTNKITASLLKELPNYMIPAVFFKIDEFPLTPNGKLDRKKLPKVKLETTNLNVGQTKTEKILAKIIAEILEVEKVDIDTPFMVLGLDSLGIIEAQTMLLQYNYNLNTQDFYKFTTIRSLAENIDSNSKSDKNQDYQIPEKFKHNIEKNDLDDLTKENDSLGNVFLTGANGFIGIHLLNELLKNTESKIYCLVRGKREQTPKERLIEQYKFYFGEDLSSYLESRVIVVDGSISEKNIGLTDNVIKKLKEDVSTVIHTAARVKHYGEYKEFERINIDGTRNVAEFSLENNFKLIHISSISVSGNYLVKQDNRDLDFTENDLYIGQNYKDNVYVNSKFEAEKIVLDYMEKGLVSQIHRIGILSGRFSDGKFQENISENAFYTRIKSMVVLGCVSKEMLEQKIEFTPVDVCSKAIINLAKTNVADNKVFHLYNHNFIEIREIVEGLKSIGVNIKIVFEEEFQNKILEISKGKDAQILFGIINDINNTKNSKISIDYNFSVNIKSDYTQKYLKSLKTEWNKIDKKYIEKIVKYMREVKFI